MHALRFIAFPVCLCKFDVLNDYSCYFIINCTLNHPIIYTNDRKIQVSNENLLTHNAHGHHLHAEGCNSIRLHVSMQKTPPTGGNLHSCSQMRFSENIKR